MESGSLFSQLPPCCVTLSWLYLSTEDSSSFPDNPLHKTLTFQISVTPSSHSFRLKSGTKPHCEYCTRPWGFPTLYSHVCKQSLYKSSLYSNLYACTISFWDQSIRLAKKFVQLFRNILWKNPNELFGQPNTREICGKQVCYSPSELQLERRGTRFDFPVLPWVP